MSDRTQGSVRTESPSGDAAAADGTPPAAHPPVSATQAIPTTGSQRAQAPATGSTPAVTQPASTGATAVAAAATGAPAAHKDAPTAPNEAPAAPTAVVGAPVGTPAPRPAGGPAGAPPVPPFTGSSAAVAPQKAGATTDAPGTTGTRGTQGRGPARTRGPRRARLQLRHIDTWSALKISLVLSIALFFIWMVAVGVLYGVLNALGVFHTLNDLFGQIGSASGSEGGGDVVTPGLVFGGAAIIGAINIVLMTALCTVGTFIYNLCSDLVGGLELTLSERD
jgi:hypothetical protein